MRWWWGVTGTSGRADVDPVRMLLVLLAGGGVRCHEGVSEVVCRPVLD